MADDPPTPATQDPNSQPDNPNPQSKQPDPPPASTPPPPQPQPQPSSTPIQLNPNPNPNNPPLVSLPPPPPQPSVSYAPQPLSTAFAVPPAAPSFRPVPQFSPLPNYQTPGVPPPGVSSGAPLPVPQHMMHYQMQQPMRPYAPMPNGYSAPPQGTIPPPVS